MLRSVRSTKIMKKRNGEIDVFRFIFSVLIVVLHFSNTFKMPYIKNGWIGVEFFFLTAGLFMAKNASGFHIERKDIANQTWKYSIRKIKRFYGYFLVSIFLNQIIRNIWIRHWTFSQLWEGFIKSIPTFGLFFLGTNSQDIGMNVPHSWFLSAMMVSCFILYPLLLLNYNSFIKLIFPVVSIVLLGYLFSTQKSLALSEQFGQYINLGILRGIAEMALGASLYELSVWLKGKILATGKKAIIISAIKYLCYLQTILFAFGVYNDKRYSLHALFFCAIGLLLSYSEAGIYIHSNSVTAYLGKISLPIYIFHGIFHHGIKEYYTGEMTIGLFFGSIVGSIIICVILMHIIDVFSNIMKRRRRT